jgi:hypothetical protein
MVSKDDYIAWRNSDITQRLYKDIAGTVEDVLAEMVNREDSKPDRDMLLRGFVKGVTAAIDWKPEFPEDQDED